MILSNQYYVFGSFNVSIGEMDQILNTRATTMIIGIRSSWIFKMLSYTQSNVRVSNLLFNCAGDSQLPIGMKISV
jgi:hypothetical protein